MTMRYHGAVTTTTKSPKMFNTDKIMAQLSAAQIEGLLRKPCRSWWGDTPACMPHRKATGEALRKLGICSTPPVGHERVFPLTPIGFAVRAALEC